MLIDLKEKLLNGVKVLDEAHVPPSVGFWNGIPLYKQVLFFHLKIIIFLFSI